MSADPSYLDITLMGREYRVACQPDERDALLAAVSYLDGKLAEIGAKTRNAPPERLAVMAALNIAHELLDAGRAGGLDFASSRRRISDMAARLDSVLAPQERLL